MYGGALNRLAFLALVFVACGDGTPDRNPGGSSIPNPVPVRHTLAQSQSITIAAGSTYGFAFSVPSPATLSFSASQTTTDVWDVAVFTTSQWAAYLNGTGTSAYGGSHKNVMQASDSLSIPSGGYYLGFSCRNLFQRCMLVFSADATY